MDFLFKLKKFTQWFIGSLMAIVIIAAASQIDNHGWNPAKWALIEDAHAIPWEEIFASKTVEQPKWKTWAFDLEDFGPMKFLPGVKEVSGELKFKPYDGSHYIGNRKITDFDPKERDMSKWTLVLLTEVQNSYGLSMNDRHTYRNSVWLDTRWMCHIKSQLGDKLQIWKLRMNKADGGKDQFHYPTTLTGRTDVLENKPECFDKYLTLTQFSKGYAIEKAYMGWLGAGDHTSKYSQTIPSAVLVDPSGKIRKRFGFGIPVKPSNYMIVGLAPHIGATLPKNLDEIGQGDKTILAYKYDMNQHQKNLEVLSNLPGFALGAIAENLESME